MFANLTSKKRKLSQKGEIGLKNVKLAQKSLKTDNSGKNVGISRRIAEKFSLAKCQKKLKSTKWMPKETEISTNKF